MANYNPAMITALHSHLDMPRNEGVVDIRTSNEQSAPLYSTNETFRNDYESMSARKESTKLSERFFSDKNIQNLQNKIRYNVYRTMNRVIDKQSNIDLHILMTNIYDEYGANNPNCIDKDMEELNTKVIDTSVRIIVTNLKQYLTFLVDKSTFPVPLDRPTNESTKGENTFERVPF